MILDELGSRGRKTQAFPRGLHDNPTSRYHPCKKLPNGTDAVAVKKFLDYTCTWYFLKPVTQEGGLVLTGRIAASGDEIGYEYD